MYLAVLYLGESHVSSIAAKVKMPRSTAQTILEKLLEEGLVNFYVMKRYKYWVAENPEKLLKNLKKREQAIEEVMPELVAIRESDWGKKGHAQDPTNPLVMFSILADGSAQPILIANEKVEIEYVNEAWEKQFGYELEEIKGENPRVLQSGKTPHVIYEQMWKALRAGKMFQTDEIIDKRKDGTFFNLLTTILPLKRKGRLFYVQILDDITERKRVEGLRQKFSQTAKF